MYFRERLHHEEKRSAQWVDTSFDWRNTLMCILVLLIASSFLARGNLITLVLPGLSLRFAEGKSFEVSFSRGWSKVRPFLNLAHQRGLVMSV